MKKQYKLLTVALVTAMLLTSIWSGNANAESVSVLEEQLQQLQEKGQEMADQIAQLEGQISQNETETQAVLNQKSIIDQEIFLLHQQLDTINAQISTLNLLIADQQDELVKAQANLAELNAKNKERIRAMEENGNLTYWSVLFKASSFSDLLDQLNMINEIARADRQRLQEMREAAQKVEEAKAELQSQKAQQEATKAQLDATQADLEEKRAQADALLAQLLAKGEEFQRLLSQSESQQSELMTQIADKEAQYDNAKYQQWLSTSVPETTPPTKPQTPPETTPPASQPEDLPQSSGWVMPISYTLLSSPFGYRWHPIHGDWRMHYGVDLAAPTGTPIYASRSGIVTTADYEDGGAGYYVSINHGDGYASIYMHMTHYIVSAGDYVNAGQVIGYCGSTGGSTGPHLHFGISYKGVYVNPADYLSLS